MMIIENGNMLIDPRKVMVVEQKKEATITIPLKDYIRLVEQDVKAKAVAELIDGESYMDVTPVKALLGIKKEED